MAYELRKLGLDVKCQVALPFHYEDITFDNGYRMDLVINDKVIVEIKSVESLHEVHHKQVITYLKLSKMKLGILVNFNTADIEKQIFRKVNGL